MANFLAAQNKVKKLEGGYTKNKADIGNWLAINGSQTGWVKNKDGKMISPFGGEVRLVGTNYGIAAPTLAAWVNSPITAADMEGMKYETAFRIYKTTYWDMINGDKINDQSVAELIYDALVQHSPKTVTKMLTETTGKAVSVPVDESEVAIINSIDGQQLFNAIKQWRTGYYKSLNNPHFEKGWLNRINSFTYTLLEKAKEAAKQVAETVSENKGASAAAGFFFLLGAGYFASRKLTNKKWTLSTK